MNVQELKEKNRVTTAKSCPVNNDSSVYTYSVVISRSSPIREDAKRLIDLAYSSSEEHLYYTETKSEFMQAYREFTSSIVHDVESNVKSYEEGNKEIEEQEKSLLKEIGEFLSNGLEYIGGGSQIISGVFACISPVSCALVGGPLILHGSNNLYETYTGKTGFLREGYKWAAKTLGGDENIGDIVYDTVDLGISVHGKIKLVPKINEYGNKIRPLYHALRSDYVRAFKQMSNKALLAEIYSDLKSLGEIVVKSKALFIVDKDTKESAFLVKDPTKIYSVEDIIEQDSCTIVIVIRGDGQEYNPDKDSYYLCTKENTEEKYKLFNNGQIELMETKIQ